jgi:hypothetical protein
MYFFYFKQKYESDMLKDRREFLSTRGASTHGNANDETNRPSNMPQSGQPGSQGEKLYFE